MFKNLIFFYYIALKVMMFLPVFSLLFQTALIFLMSLFERNSVRVRVVISVSILFSVACHGIAIQNMPNIL